MIIITDHANTRGHERLGIRGEALLRTAQRAWETGLRHGYASGRLNRYLDKLFLSHGKADQLRIHAEHVWVFSGKTLITILELPKEFRPLVEKLKRRAKA